MKRYLVLINWKDASGTEIEVAASNKNHAIDKAIATVWWIKEEIHSCKVLNSFKLKG
jgi:hypothetical protein